MRPVPSITLCKTILKEFSPQYLKPSTRHLMKVTLWGCMSSRNVRRHNRHAENIPKLMNLKPNLFAAWPHAITGHGINTRTQPVESQGVGLCLSSQSRAITGRADP
ncbi:hypothetical protein TNCV_337841 [Trichonephila clavipes]|nr:hypothetical protein TNCV_337841 [Trichonephila clavipes]